MALQRPSESIEGTVQVQVWAYLLVLEPVRYQEPSRITFIKRKNGALAERKGEGRYLK